MPCVEASHDNHGGGRGVGLVVGGACVGLEESNLARFVVRCEVGAVVGVRRLRECRITCVFVCVCVCV